MAHEVIFNKPTPKKKKSNFNVKLPKNISGKFGLSLNLGKKEFFIGLAIADIEMETVVKKRRVKVLPKMGKSAFVAFD